MTTAKPKPPARPTLGRLLRSLRMRNDWTLKEMSKRTGIPLSTLAKVEQWSHQTSSGDLAELDGLDERSSVIPLVTSSRENCLGQERPQFRQCHVLKARREAMLADVVATRTNVVLAPWRWRRRSSASIPRLMMSCEEARLVSSAAEITSAAR